ncbi:hypothetical protein BC834DRAFT_924701 [Gloeopeniophorella convolvens]|nr:hypothetical protein BC834DRAFT_924701 [Gloeopeniophorella convolvens]
MEPQPTIQRRRSVDSSSSSDQLPAGGPQFPQPQTSEKSDPAGAQAHFPEPQHHDPPPGYAPPAQERGFQEQQKQQHPPPPPSGYRIPLSTHGQFPRLDQARAAPFTDSDGRSPVFVGSALMDGQVHPCKVAPHLAPTPCRVPWGGGELEHSGRYDLLPFVPEQMEWVPAAHGQVPAGRRPIEGGYESNGAKLYHAAVWVNGVKVPGKTGTHLGGANVAFGLREHSVSEGYEILCWRL